MLIIERAKMEFTGGHIGIILNIEMVKKELTAGNIGFMIIIDLAKIVLIGRHIGIMLIIIYIYWIYCIYIDYHYKINRRPYCIYAIYRDGENKN